MKRPSLWRRAWWSLTGHPARRCTCGCWTRHLDGCDCRFCNEPYPTGVSR